MEQRIKEVERKNEDLELQLEVYKRENRLMQKKVEKMMEEEGRMKRQTQELKDLQELQRELQKEGGENVNFKNLVR